MNFSSWLGIAVAGGVLYFGVFHGSPNAGLFVDPHALLLVCGGTLAAALISLRFSQLEDLLSLFWFGMILKRRKPTLVYARELLQVSLQSFNRPINYVSTEVAHPFLREALYHLKRDYLNDEELAAVLKQRSEYFRRLYQGDAKALNNLGKFPPAFGLLGATTGMISMMSSLGSNQDQIGPAMAVALVATFWGIAVANLLILPMADYASKLASEDQVNRQMIIEAVMLSRLNTEPAVVCERIATYLPPHQRSALREGFENELAPPNVIVTGENVTQIRRVQ
jgi:chemotaxis protein MotA